MCLLTTNVETKRFEEQFDPNDTIQVWKVYEAWNSNELISPYRYSAVQKAGVVKSDRKNKKRNWKDNKDIHTRYGRGYFTSNVWEINHGIHVYTTRKAALEAANKNPFTLTVVCCHAKIKDLVGYNNMEKQAVFTEIEISPRNFKRALKRHKQKRFSMI